MEGYGSMSSYALLGASQENDLHHGMTCSWSDLNVEVPTSSKWLGGPKGAWSFETEITSLVYRITLKRPAYAHCGR